ncbi:IreB family regulatory phosphoprotein [Candidatus Saccharibacteria bacterium]|nr:IreB family regulatory phosphoprotein [Candidatus Saccharibacteria bacterium]
MENGTERLNTNIFPVADFDEDLRRVYGLLAKNGYNPVNQIVGYIISDDPTYITAQGGARVIMSKYGGGYRDEILRVMLIKYLVGDSPMAP